MVDGAPQTAQEYIDQNPVMVFSKDYCPFANRAKQTLKSKGVEFGVIELDLDPNGGKIHAELK